MLLLYLALFLSVSVMISLFRYLSAPHLQCNVSSVSFLSFDTEPAPSCCRWLALPHCRPPGYGGWDECACAGCSSGATVCVWSILTSVAIILRPVFRLWLCCLWSISVSDSPQKAYPISYKQEKINIRSQKKNCRCRLLHTCSCQWN